jgi:predicted nicotinamide N-methyase
MTISPLCSPTQSLPIGEIKHSSVEDLRVALGYLGLLYNPEVRLDHQSYRRTCIGQCLPRHDIATYRLAASDSEVCQPSFSQLDTIRADGFERMHAIRWLTTLVSRIGQLDMDDSDTEPIVQDAAGLLAICAGTAAAGTRSRAFVFSQPDKISNVKVQLIDLPLDNQDYTSVGAQTWGGGCLLADMLVQAPSDFGLRPPPGRPLRVLELGAGTGLVGLAAGKLLQELCISSELVLSDFHPTVLDNLRNNVASNFPDTSASVSIAVHCLDWSQFATLPSSPVDALFDRPFDIILGADIVYEIEHAKWLRCCVETLLRRPPVESIEAFTMTQLNPQFHLVIPLRATHVAEAQSVEQLFPLALDVRDGIASPPEGTPAVQSLAIVGKEILICEDMARSSGSEVEYCHYIISWV